MPELESHSQSRPTTHKRCPYCYTHLRLDAQHCLECKKKVGKMDKFGLAKKPINYKAYLASLLWVILLVIYIWKVFLGKMMGDS